MTTHKKKKKSWVSNGIFIGILLIIFFTPIGKELKIWVNRLLSFSPSVEKVEKRELLTDYNWQLLDGDGNIFDLKQAKGKVLFLNFWATWCPPCIAELPALQKLYDEYKNNDDIIFLFATTDSKATVDAFMEKHNYTIPTHYIQSAPPEQLASRSIPVTFLIGKNGAIAIKKTGSAEWYSKTVLQTIEELLQE